MSGKLTFINEFATDFILVPYILMQHKVRSTDTAFKIETLKKQGNKQTLPLSIIYFNFQFLSALEEFERLLFRVFVQGFVSHLCHFVVICSGS